MHRIHEIIPWTKLQIATENASEGLAAVVSLRMVLDRLAGVVKVKIRVGYKQVPGRR